MGRENKVAQAARKAAEDYIEILVIATSTHELASKVEWVYMPQLRSIGVRRVGGRSVIQVLTGDRYAPDLKVNLAYFYDLTKSAVHAYEELAPLLVQADS